MKIRKTKAIQLIDEKISLFLKILSEAKYENRFNEEYQYAYSSTKQLLTELFSKDEAINFEKEVSVHSPISFLDDEIDYEEDLKDYKEHVNRCSLQLKVYKEKIQNFWRNDNINNDYSSKRSEIGEEIMKSKKRVFVVHGRNEEARNAMFDFLRSLGLEPIEWSEAISFTEKGTPHIGEILDQAFNKAHAVIVLFTGDEIAKLYSEFLKTDDPPYEKEFKPQARPNVLFEAGMAFGREPNRTILVQLGYVRPFSDIAGRNLVKISNKPEDRQKLASRLKTAGCDFDTNNKTDWFSKGDFDGALHLHQKSLEGENKLHQPVLDSNQSGVTAPGEAQPAILDQIQTEILKCLASVEKLGISRYMHDTDISKTLNIDITVLRYNLEKLKNLDYITPHYFGNKPTGYSLKNKGRAYLVEHQIVK